MADSKITALTALTAADPANDMMPIVDVSDTSMAASGTTKRISINNILACSPSATLASLNVTGSSIPANGLYLPTTNTLEFSANSLAQYRIAPLGVFSWYDGAGGTRMTLDSTGLGVGGSPTSKLSIFAGADGDIGFFRGGSTRQLQLGTSATAGYLNVDNGSAGFELRVNGVARVYADTSGNVGVGVTPSAKLDVSANDGTMAIFRSSGGSSNDKRLTISSGGAKVVFNISDNSNTATARAYEFQTAGSAAMTLDASGNLLVGKTATNSGTVGVEIQPNGNVWATKSASTSAATAWDTYSTGAGAYRFYVGMDGTVNATNTTISAISDARLKENVQDIDVGLGAILALKPRKFDWKAGKGKDIKGDRGFIAQEFEQVFPQLVDEWKDEAPEGEAPYKSVRQDLIPVLVKAIQELTARVQTLETR